MSDTPESDSAERMAFANEYMVPTEVARRLECERDEAREVFISSKRARASLSKACDSLQKELRETKRERDEAREALIEARKHREQLNSLLQSYEACWDEIKTTLGEPEEGDQTCDLDRVLKAIRERDEAREQLAAAKHFLEKYIAERDEAKAEVARTKSILLDANAVFANFLHGKIAKLDWEKLEHIHGFHPARAERDEARERAAQWESSSDAMERAGAEQARRADENREWALRAERERDEARSMTEHQWLLRVGSRLCVAGCKSDGILDSIDEIIRERDEAREALLKIEEVFVDGDDTYEDWKKMGSIARSVLEAAK